MVAVAGDSAMCQGTGGDGQGGGGLVAPSVPVTVWAPAMVALQLAPVQRTVGGDGEGGGPRHVTEGVAVVRRRPVAV